MNKHAIFAMAGALAVLTAPGLAGLWVGPDDTDNTQPQTATEKTVKQLDAKTGIPVGWTAPNVELKNAEGETVKLNEIYAQGPTVVAFYRGGWCPFCNQQLREWQDYASDFEEAGVNVFFITPESVENVNGSIEKTETTYSVLSDSEHEAAELFNVIFRVDGKTQQRYKGFGVDLKAWNASKKWKLPVPGVFLIDTDGVVRWRDVNEDYRVRVDPELVLEAIEAL